MNEMPIQRNRTGKPGSLRLGTFMAMVLVAHTVGITIFVGFLGVLILGIPARNLLVPYAMLVYCGLVLAPPLYWTLVARERPKSCALRFAITMFLYLQVLQLALGFSAIKLHILSLPEAISDFGPFVLPVSALMFAASYHLARQLLKDTQGG